jgi:RNA-directed DNA polymerase
LEVDIRKFFDTLDHAHLRELLRQRVRDGVVLRLIGKWLNAGVMEGGAVTYPSTGSPQGGVISPLLANVYLRPGKSWFQRTRPRHRAARGSGWTVSADRQATHFLHLSA